MARRLKTTGKERFIDYYKQFFGSKKEMGKFLYDLESRNNPILRFHPSAEEVLKAMWKEAKLPWKTLKWFPYALEWPKDVPPKTLLPGANEHLFYPMNSSSLLPVLALDIKGDESVLDACAAPGGKALFLSHLLDNGKLTANDSSFDRVRRMRGIFKDHHVKNAEVWSKPGATIFKSFPEQFDKILVDAPCSAEKHVWNSAKYLDQWTARRVKDNTYRQISLLSGLFLALKPGGRMVYSTCAFTPDENEEVVEKLLKKKKDQIKLIKFNPKTPGHPGLGGMKKVWRVYPENNMDPMFVALFEKKA